jgi:protoporphyrinogen oxidase
MNRRPDEQVLVIGAGPAGLTAGYRLARRGERPLVLEGRDKVGGLACTEEYKGFLFDMGGHRFYSKDPSVYEIWNEVLPDDFVVRSRLSRIYYRGKFFDYPLRPLSALRSMGPIEALAVGGSYLRWKLFPHRPEDTFERWVTNRFGERLFRMFFRSYTEKVWGIPCSEISAEWAAQRIQNLSLTKAIAGMLPISNRNGARTLIHEFHYPRKGPGMMWKAMSDAIEAQGGEVRLRTKVTSILRSGDRVHGIALSDDGSERYVPASHVISSMPITSALRALDPPPPREVLEAADRLRYRDFLTVCLIVQKPDVFPDQWIYVHDPGVRMGRIQNYKNWSPDMVPDPAMTGVGLEYFCTAGDDLWTLADEALVELGTEELARIGLVDRADVVDGTVFRMTKAYPVYDSGYGRHREVLRRYAGTLENFQTVGRNGLFRYNNMDHSMLTGVCAVENLAREEWEDVWTLNEEPVYIEATVGERR